MTARSRQFSRTVAVLAGGAVVVSVSILAAAPVSAAAVKDPTPTVATWPPGTALTPRTQFTMAPDGSSGAAQPGAGIPNIDSVKKTIATYYGDPGTGIANKTSSPYITQVDKIAARATAALAPAYRAAIAHHQKPALVFDTDDTTLFTYDMEVGAMHFNFDPALQNEWVQDEKFTATPGMVSLVNQAKALGFTVFGLTGRNDNQKAATLDNLATVGYTAFTNDNFYTKWTGVGSSQQPSYIHCAATACTTVEYKAETRAHIESLGYTIVGNFGDQYSDLQGGHAEQSVKLPNPTYYLPSPDLPGLSEPNLSPRTHFVMAPDGSSGATQGGEGIPNIDSVKKTIAIYYGDPGTGVSNKTSSPYITELTKLVGTLKPALTAACTAAAHDELKPAMVFDADDTTLWTYDMEVAAMHFNFNPTLQDFWVQNKLFPATPAMVPLVNAVGKAGCTVIGLTGRNDNQKQATLDNLAQVGYRPFTAKNYFTKWTGTGASQRPSYVTCVASCTTIEYKSQTRAYVESKAFGSYKILANFGDQFSDLIGGHSLLDVKLPNPTYYLP